MAKLTVKLASPRGFCAGVVRAIDTLERALEAFGPPLYVHHDIVHNPHVVADFAARGAIFVEDVEAVPRGGRLVISAHGAPPKVAQGARERGIRLVDATCPLVTKVHREISHHAARGRHILLIGHGDHVETIGSAGQVSPEQVTVIESSADAARLDLPREGRYAYATQTTLSIADTTDIITRLADRFPDLVGPGHADICYATTNRQAAVAQMAEGCDGFVIIGGASSSNSQRLVEEAKRAGCARTWFVSRGAEAAADWFDGLGTLGVSSGASTPEAYVEELLAMLRQRFDMTLKIAAGTEEQEHYNLPPMRAFERDVAAAPY